MGSGLNEHQKIRKMLKEKYIENNVLEGKDILIQNVKLVLYKKHPSIFEELDFENDEIYIEPLLFAGLNSKHQPDSNDLMWGYKSEDSKTEMTTLLTDENGFCYMPNIGCFKTNLPNTKLSLTLNKSEYVLSNESGDVKFRMDNRVIIHNRFEVLTNPNYLLNEHFFDGNGKDVDVEIIETTKLHLEHIEMALDIIKKVSPSWYDLMSQVIRKFVIFKSPTFLLEGIEVVERNSFATQSVHGCAFFNAFQDDYNEVFFIEDIAHQCGHVIFNAFMANKPDICKVDLETQIYNEGPRDEYNEPRSLFEVVHAMYTYESIFVCLGDCIKNNIFEGHKLHELRGRLFFAISKFVQDFQLIMIKDEANNSVYWTEEGIEMLLNVYKLQKTYIANWGNDLQELDLTGQPYNFSYSAFLEKNPLEV